jgi:hypothetical protein
MQPRPHPHRDEAFSGDEEKVREPSGHFPVDRATRKEAAAIDALEDGGLASDASPDARAPQGAAQDRQRALTPEELRRKSWRWYLVRFASMPRA